MAKSLSDVLRAQLGDLIFQVSVLVQQNEELREQIERLKDHTKDQKADP